MYNTIVLLLLVCCVSPLVTATSNIAMDWAEFLESIKSHRPPLLGTGTGFVFHLHPGPNRRIDSIMDWCMYNTWALYDSKARTTIDLGIMRVFQPGTPANLRKAISFAAYRCLKHEFRLFPDTSYTNKTDDFFEQLGYDKSDTSTNLFTPSGAGNYVAAKVTAYADSDGTNSGGSHPTGNGQIYSDYTKYIHPNDPMPQVGKVDCDALRSRDHIQTPRIAVALAGDGANESKLQDPFTDVVFTKFRTWGLTALGQHLVDAPPRFDTDSEDLLVQDHQELINISATLDDEMKALAVYAQSTQSFPRSYVMSALRVLDLDLEDTLKLLIFQSQVAMETMCSQFFGKRFYQLARPTTIIQCHHDWKNQTFKSWKGPYQGVGLINGSDWTAYLMRTVVQNNGPEYPCGHCTITSGFSEGMRLFFGSDIAIGQNVVIPEGSSFVEPKITNTSDPLYVQNVTDVPNTGPESVGYAPATNISLTFSTWTEFSQKIILARMYLGVHTRFSGVAGEEYGKQISRTIWKRFQDIWEPF
jgi:hypothetical protein